MSITNAGGIGVGTTTPGYLLEVNGSAGKPGGGVWTATSDSRLKQSVQPYNDGLTSLMKINPVRFHYNEKSGYDTKPEYVGVIAQELQVVAPYMVNNFQKNGETYLNVDNSAMIYMLINAVKEQQQQIEELKKETPTGQLSKAQVEELKMGLIKDAEVLELLGLAKEPIVSPRLGLMNGLEVYIKGDDKGDFSYEAKIPFKAFRIDKAAIKVLGVAFVTGKMPPPKAQNTTPAGGGAGNMGYARRGYGMGGMGGGMGGYGSAGYSQPSYSEWNSSTYMSVGVKLK